MIHKTQLATVDAKLIDIGVQVDGWEDFSIVLSKVTGWRTSIDENDKVLHGETAIYLGGDKTFTINTPYIEFSKLMHDLYKLNNNLAQ